MSNRHALVIGSTCDALPANPLKYVKADTQALFDALTDADRGGCELEDSRLLVHPGMVTMTKAIKSAVHRAAQDRASLIVSFLGHAVLIGTDNTAKKLYLLPRDGSATPDSDTGYEFGHRLAEILSSADSYGLDGLLVLLDVCYGGVGLLNCAQDTAAVAAESKVRIEMLAAVFDQTARQGCFTKTLTHAIRRGIPSLSSDFLTTVEAVDVVAEKCPNEEEPLRFAMARGRRVSSDPSLWIARNPESLNAWPLAGTHAGGLAVELTRAYQLTNVIKKTLTAVDESRVTFIHGSAGSGKSALVAALSRPTTAPKLIPAAYLSATAFGALTPTIEELASDLNRQLMRQETFRDAVGRYSAGFELQRELDIQPPLQRLVLGPLAHVSLDETDLMRIAVDAIDHFAPSARDEFVRAVTQCVASQPEGWQVRFLITCRGEIPSELVDPGASVLTIKLLPPERSQITHFLMGRGLVEAAVDLIADHAESWLDVIVLYEALGTVEPEHLTKARRLDRLYDAVLGPVIADPEARALITVLATSGSGPVLPAGVLAGVSALIGGPSEPGVVRDIVAQLGRWVARSKPGTADERMGVCHESLLAWFRSQEKIRCQLDAAHELMLQYLRTSTDEAALGYRRRFEAEHLWQRRWYAEAVELVCSQCEPRPVDNMALVSGCVDRAEATLPEDDRSTLRLRSELALWTGRSGALTDALSLCRDVIRGRNSTLGANHRETLISRLMFANFLGRTGDTSGALNLSQRTHTACEQAFGLDDPLSMEAESDAARWTGQCGGWEESLASHLAVLEKRERVLSQDHRDTHKTRGHIAHVLGRLGRKAEAATAYADLAAEQERLFGPTDPDLLNTRLCVVRWIGSAGDNGAAVRLAFELIPIISNVLGPDDPMTLDAWSFFAQYKAAGGHLKESVEAYDYLIPRYQRVLEPTNTSALYARINRATAVARDGDGPGALQDIETTVREYAHLLGPDHADVLWARGQEAYWMARSGDSVAAGQLYEHLIADRARIFGNDDRQLNHFRRLLDRFTSTGQVRRPGSDKKDRDAREAVRISDWTLDTLLASQREKSRVLRYTDFVVDQVRRAIVTATVNFGVFVDVGGFTGLVHVSELSWGSVDHPSEVVSVGDWVTVVVKRVDDERHRVEFSLKHAQPDPLLNFSRQHPIGCEIVGTVARLSRHSADVDLPGGFFGFLRAPQSGTAYGDLQVDQQVPVRVKDIDIQQRRIDVALLDAKDVPDKQAPGL